jgi:SagB-type dehydrogenase family enzyme
VTGAPPDLAPVYRYHDGTKHHFHRFARSLGYLDWAAQPHPFRAFHGAPFVPLYPSPAAQTRDYAPPRVSWGALFHDDARPPVACSAEAIGDLLRHSLGLSAWKQFGNSRWSLRVNPSSGNLHPTEAYVAAGSSSGLGGAPGVFHYAADRHGLELRCAIGGAAWSAACDGFDDVVLVALTSIHWREAWKYGERAFRYCQHDVGHAIAALAVAARILGWRATLLPAWSHAAIAAFVGIDREGDFVEAEPEVPACVLALAPGVVSDAIRAGADRFVAAARAGRWTGRASQLSEDHVEWTFIDEIARATVDSGCDPASERVQPEGTEDRRWPRADAAGLAGWETDARSLALQRRSALAFDGRWQLDRSAFLAILSRVMPADQAPWTTLWWPPRVHLAMFIHRIDGLPSGLYLLARGRSEASASDALERLKQASAGEFLWERVDDDLPLVCLERGDLRRLAERLSCDQEIAADGFFSLGMVADFEETLTRSGPAFYRHLFWETGFVGQLLYLDAEAAGARATGIGCFYDDPVHEALGLRGRVFQSLYHFTIGVPVEDRRLTSQPGYEWERS